MGVLVSGQPHVHPGAVGLPSVLAALAMASVGMNKAIGATSTGRELRWWWQLLGLGQWEKARGKRDSPPRHLLCVLPGVTPSSALSPRGNHMVKGTGICA